MVEPTDASSHTSTAATVDKTMIPPSYSITPSNYPSTKPTSNLEVVMILDVPFAQVSQMWNKFSVELTSMLQSYSLNPLSMDVKEDM